MKRALAAVVALLAVVACSGDDKPKPPKIEGVEVFEGLSHKHVTTDVTYPQTPPVGGEHAPVWLGCAVYTEPVPEENAVHSMEHGAIWITYDPALSQDEVQRLTRLQGLKPEYVLISPLQGLPSKVVASTWGLRLKADAVDDPRLAEFVKEYAGGNQGGEQGADCVRGATPDQIKAGAGAGM
jgi:hypothetical protein